MHTRDFDQLLHYTKSSPLPACPNDLEAKVLRRIHIYRTEQAQQPPGWIWDLVFKPSVIACVLTSVFLLSSAVTFALSLSDTPHNERKLLASTALDFRLLHQNSIFRFEDE